MAKNITSYCKRNCDPDNKVIAEMNFKQMFNKRVLGQCFNSRIILDNKSSSLRKKPILNTKRSEKNEEKKHTVPKCSSVVVASHFIAVHDKIWVIGACDMHDFN